MNKISCDICMDLMPLVRDGVASEDSCQAVLDHLEGCAMCRAMYEGENQVPAPSNPTGLLEKIQKRAQIFFAMVMMFGIFYGLMLTAGSGIFYNTMIMPVIGAIGYYLFRWRGLYIIPALLLGTHFLTNALGLGEEYLNLYSLLLWTGIYCVVALVGFVIAALLHFVFKKEEKA